MHCCQIPPSEKPLLKDIIAPESFFRGDVQDRVSLCDSGCIGTCSVDQVGFELRSACPCLLSAPMPGLLVCFLMKVAMLTLSSAFERLLFCLIYVVHGSRRYVLFLIINCSFNIEFDT